MSGYEWIDIWNILLIFEIIVRTNPKLSGYI